METTKQRLFAPGRPVVGRIVLRFGIAVLLATSAGAAASVGYYWMRCQAMRADVQLYKVVPSESSEFVSLSLTSVVVPPLVVSAIVIVLAAAFAAFYFSYRIASAILRLEREMDEVGKGNLSRVVRLRGTDAMQEIGEHFSAMTLRLSDDLRSAREESVNLAQTADALVREVSASPGASQPIQSLSRAIRAAAARLRERLDQFTLR